MKKGYCRGVVSCDPSLLGLAFTIHIPSLNYNKSLLYNIRDRIPTESKRKKIFNPTFYLPLLIDLFDEIVEEEPSIFLCDKLIIESQFHENMKTLSKSISLIMMCKFPGLKVEQMSALKCKRFNNVPYGVSHFDNKKNMYNYVKENQKTLIAGDTLIDHNTADSIIILNTWLSLKKRHFYTNHEDYATMADDLDFVIKNSWFTCPICKFDTGKIFQIKNAKNAAMNGGHFVKCQNTKCGTSSFFGKLRIQLDKENKIGNAKVGIWKKSEDGSNKPKHFFRDRDRERDRERARADGSLNTIAVERLGRYSDDESDEEIEQPRKRRKLNSSEETDGDNPLQDIVTSLAKDQNELKQTMFDLEQKRKEDFDKLFAAIAMGGITSKPSAPEPQSVEKTPKAPTTRRKAAPKKFDTDVDPEAPL